MGKDLNGKEFGTGISQRKNGTYVARYVNVYGERKSIYDKDLNSLKRKYSKAIANNVLGNTVLNESMTLKQWFDIWLASYKHYIREDSKVMYTMIFTNHIEPYLGNRKFCSISKVQCVALLNCLKDKGLGWAMLNKVRLIIGDMYNRGIEDNYATKNPMRGVKLPLNRPKNERRVLSRNEQALFFECSAGTFYNNLFVVAINTGLRPGEIFALSRKGDIDFEANEITVSKTLVYQKYLSDTKKEFHLEPPKTQSSYRKVPINRMCAVALKKQLIQKNVVEQRMGINEQFPDLLFTTARNTPINSQILSDAIDRIVNEVNLMLTPLEQIERFSGHCFRHTFATRAIEAGVTPKTLQKYLGHATLQMTMDLYVHVSNDTKQLEMEKLESTMEDISKDLEDMELRLADMNDEKIVRFNLKTMA